METPLAFTVFSTHLKFIYHVYFVSVFACVFFHRPHCNLLKVEAICYTTSYVPIPQCFYGALSTVYIHKCVTDHALEPSMVWVVFLEEVGFELDL